MSTKTETLTSKNSIGAKIGQFTKDYMSIVGILLLIIISLTLNKVMLLGTSRTEVKIVSARAHEIRDEILTRVDRGVTLLHGEGGYLHVQTEIVMSVISSRELVKLERVVHAIDPECFMVVSRVSEVKGRGFSMNKKYEKEQ